MTSIGALPTVFSAWRVARKKRDMYCCGTTNLTNHLKSWHKAEFKLVTENQVVSKLVQSETILGHFKSKSIMWPKSSEKWKKLTMSLAKWFCKNSRLTAMVEDEGFAAFMALACPSYELPSRKTLSKYIEELYQKEQKKIKSSLEDVEFCAISTDGGSTCVCLAPVRRLRGCSHGWGGC